MDYSLSRRWLFLIMWVRIETKWNERAADGGEMRVLPEEKHVCVCVCVFLLYSVQLGGQRSPLSTTALLVYLAHS